MKLTVLFSVNLNEQEIQIFEYRVRVAIMTHFCIFGTATAVLIIGFGLFFFLMDGSRSQAVLMQVLSALLNSDSSESEM